MTHYILNFPVCHRLCQAIPIPHFYLFFCMYCDDDKPEPQIQFPNSLKKEQTTHNIDSTENEINIMFLTAEILILI